MQVPTKLIAIAAVIGFSSILPLPGLLQQPPTPAQATMLTLVWVDRSGNVQPLGAPPRAYGLPRLSPDSQRVAVGIGGPKADIWIYDIPRGALTKLAADGNNQYPTWSPDGKRIAFASGRGGPASVFWKRADGSGEEERLTTAQYNQGPQTFSPDGQLLSFYEIHPETGRDIWMLPLTGERKPWSYLRTPKLEGGVAFSPDGRWIAYASNETDRFEIYVQPFQGPGERVRVSFQGGTEVIWLQNGRELFYRQDDKRMVVEVTTQPTLTVGKPRMLFEGKFQRSPGSRANWDATPDGQRFLMLQAAE